MKNNLATDEYVILDKKILQHLEETYIDTLSHKYSKGFFDTESGRIDLDANITDRYNHALKHVLPWVNKQQTLAGKKMLEIGCGTGSSTAAFAHFVDEITGYDIDQDYIDFARKRFEITGIDNAQARLVTETNLTSTLKERYDNGVDIILLYAVLEHQTVEERIETIKTCWNILNNDGLIVVADTPNLLIYNDFHTSQLPFLHFLPDLSYKLYSAKSPREDFNSHFKRHSFDDPIELSKAITRWGRGVSFHDFELSLGTQYRDYIVANGFEEEILSWISVELEEELLRMYVLKNNIDIPLAFTRFHLNLILKKSDLPSQDSGLPDAPGFSTIADHQEVKKLERTLAATEKELSLILQSKRWAVGNIIAWPYRTLKQFLSNSRGV